MLNKSFFLRTGTEKTSKQPFSYIRESNVRCKTNPIWKLEGIDLLPQERHKGIRKKKLQMNLQPQGKKVRRKFHDLWFSQLLSAKLTNRGSGLCKLVSTYQSLHLPILPTALILLKPGERLISPRPPLFGLVRIELRWAFRRDGFYLRLNRCLIQSVR